MKQIKFNINDMAKVKLTDYGRDIYYHQFDKLNEFSRRIAIKPHMPKEDKDGYYKTQFWCLMNIFGKYVGMGNKKPFETEIILIPEES